MTFAWDEHKAAANLKDHGVDFREAATVFDDPLSSTFPDEEHSTSERRCITIGLSALGRMLDVTPSERKFYEEE